MKAFGVRPASVDMLISATALVAHMRRDSACETNGAHQVDLEAVAPIFFGSVEHVTQPAITGIVDEDIDPAELFYGLIDRTSDLLRACYIGSNRENVAAMRAERIGRFIKVVFVSCTY